MSGTNLLLAAKLIRRLDKIGGKLDSYEGVPLAELADSCIDAARDLHDAHVASEIRRAAFRCQVDESAGMAELIDLHDFSKRVGA